MWDLGNRDVIVLVSVISGWVILLNIFGPYLGFAITIVLVVCGWLTYIVADDTPFTPHAHLALDYLEEALGELKAFLTNIYQLLFTNTTSIILYVRNLYRIYIYEKMAQRRRSTYQLSLETRSSTRNNSSRYGLVDGLSPIPRGTQRPVDNSSNVENSPYVHSDTRIFHRTNSLGQITSTPLISWRTQDARNGDIFSTVENATGDRNSWKKSQSFTQNHTLSRGEERTYSPEGSPWGTSISPKMRSRAAGVKTVQTVAGPLLASTRYNIDPKVYSDVTSPGLTSRLTRYATEANTKLTHQSQYGTGQFPRVNLNASPTPLINAKTGKMRMPVTVRVAPPEKTRYSPPERQQILSEIHRAESKPSPSVVQVLREISLKRHASREDVTSELAKKQRTEGVFGDGLENLEEMTQKRGRDESSRSEEETSPLKSLRPAKRSKMPSCHDILSSLSSSIGVSSGVKRKAGDVSRSGTPDVGKHFKSLDSSQEKDGVTYHPLSRSVSEPMKSNKNILNEQRGKNSLAASPTEILASLEPKEIIEASLPIREVFRKDSGDSRPIDRGISQREIDVAGENVRRKPTAPVKLTDKLFMKAEPENIDKIKTLIEEHGSIKPRFTTDATEEIKKSDIVNMRQTSMKNRLKSMFDAISGKATNKINPEVVIQAEDKSFASASIAATLSSTTSTTNVNTSPIATSAIVPIIGKTKPATTPAKHVTFQFTSNETPQNNHSIEFSKVPTSDAISSSGIVETRETTSLKNSVLEKSISADSVFPSSNPTSSTTVSLNSSMFANPSISTSPKSSTMIPTPSSTTSTSSNILSTTTTAMPHFDSQSFNSPSKLSIFQIPTTSQSQSVSSSLQSFSTTTSEKTSHSQTPSISFGAPKIEAPTMSNNQSTSLNSTQPSESLRNQAASTPSSSLSSVTTTSGGLFTFGATASKPASNVSMTSGFNATNSGSLFNGSTQATEKKGFTFGGTASLATTATTAASSSIFQTPVITTTSQNAPKTLATTTSTSSGFNFSTANSPSVAVFGSSSLSTTTPSSGLSSSTSTAPTFTFGTNPSAPVTKSGFSFETNPATTSTTSTTSSSIPSLSFAVTTNTAVPVFGGSSSTPSSTMTQPSIFGAPTTAAATTTSSSMTAQPSMFGTPATTSSATSAQPTIFGVPATSSTGFATGSGSSTFGTSAQSSTFAASSSTANTFGTPKTMGTPVFGSTTSGPPLFSTTTTSSSLFSGVNAEANATKSVTLPSFGTSGFGQKAPTFGANTAPATNFSSNTGAASSLFNAQPTEPFGASATTRSPAKAYNFTSASTPTFGTPSTAPPAFGATSASTTSFGTTTTPAPAFGSISTTIPSFGTANPSAGTIGNPNATSTNFSAPGATFGATTTAPPTFPTSITPASTGFGNPSTSTAFGTSNNPPPAFSASTPSFAGFGAANSSATSPFGAQANTGSSTFGATSPAATGFAAGNTNNTANTTFTFGAAQPTAQPQQNPVFSFGAGSTTSGNSSASTSAPFQFGAVAPQTGGFNFTGAPTTPAINFSKDGAATGSFGLPTPGANSFSVPPTTGGMFSIGSGSTASRTRPSRRRQR